MLDVIDLAELSKLHSPAAGHSEVGKIDPPTRADNSKDLHLQVVRSSSSANFQDNWNRGHLLAVELTKDVDKSVFPRIPRVGCLQARRFVLPQFDADAVVDCISKHGGEAVIKITHVLRVRNVPEEKVRALRELLVEVMHHMPLATHDGAEFTLGQHENFVNRARRLDEKGRTDAGLDLLYDAIDGMMRNGEFSELDSLIRELPIDELSLDILLGVLTATLPARSKLESRAHFFRDVEADLKHRGEYEEGLLTGLE